MADFSFSNKLLVLFSPLADAVQDNHRKMDAQECNTEDRHRWLGRLPPGLQSVFAWVNWLIRPLVALVALYGCLYLLQFVGLLPRSPDQFTSAASSRIEFDTTYHPEYVLVSGQTEPNMRIEAGVNYRSLETGWSDKDGYFNIRLRVPYQTRFIWIETRDPQADRIVNHQGRAFSWGEDEVQPTLDIAFAVNDSDWLWVAGQAAPDAWIQLKTETGNFAEPFQADDIGIFDRIVPLFGDPPATLQAYLASFEDTPPSSPLNVTNLTSVELPLARIADIYINEGQPTLNLQVKLPNNHPYYRALAQGYLSDEEFAYLTFGKFYDPSSYASRWDFKREDSIDSSIAHINLEGHWFEVISKFALVRGPGGGIAARPMLTVQDELTLHYEQVERLWPDDPQPYAKSNDMASWRGPLEVSPNGQVISGGLALPGDGRTGQLEQPANRSPSGTDLLESIWGHLILLIPYLGVLWLGRRRSLASSSIWKSITVMAFILAFWRLWSFFSYLLLSIGPGAWLNRTFPTMLNALGFGDNLNRSGVRLDADSNPFWLIFVLFVILATLYFPAIERNLDWRPAQPKWSRRSWLRRLWNTVRTIYGLVVMTLLSSITYVFTLPWEERPDLYEQVWDFLSERYWLDEYTINSFLELFNYPQIIIISLIFLAVLLLLAFSWRAALFGFGFVAVMVYALDVRSLEFPSLNPASGTELLEVVQRIPWWIVVVFAGLTAYPFILRLLQRLTPTIKKDTLPWPQRRLAMTLVFITIILVNIPSTWSLVVSGCLVFWALCWLVYKGLRELEPVTRLTYLTGRWPWIFLIALAAITLLIVWPAPGTAATLQFRDLRNLVAELDNIFVPILALALILVLRAYAIQDSNVPTALDSTLLEQSVLFFAAFVINNAATWPLVPIPFIVGLFIARFWLLRPDSKNEALATETKEGRDQMVHFPSKETANSVDQSKLLALIDTHFNLENLRTLCFNLSVDYGNLGGEGKKGKARELILEMSDCDRLDELLIKIAAERPNISLDQVYKKTLDVVDAEIMPDRKLRESISAAGKLDTWKNTTIVMKFGIGLAIVPTLIGLVAYWPTNQERNSYQAADLIAFLIQIITPWLLYASFFGYFYKHLRGKDGLSKGFNMFIGIVASVLPYALFRFLDIQSSEELWRFFLWTTLLFLFCTLLGVLAVDYRLLRQKGFSARHLKTIYSPPVFFLYMTAIILAFGVNVGAIVTGQFKDVVDFLLRIAL